MRMKSTDQRILGTEPSFTSSSTRFDVMRGYNWYNYFFDSRSARGFVIDYMRSKKYSDKDISTFEKVKDDNISMTLCSASRMVLRGAKIEWNIDGIIRNIIDSYKEEEVVQRIMYDENRLIAELDSILDQFYMNGYKDNFQFADIIKTFNKQVYVRSAIQYYSEILAELESIPNDEGIKEAYSHLTKTQLNNYVAFLKRILLELTQEKVNNQRQIVRKPRKIKVKSAEQLTKKVKYQTSDPSLNVTSIEPSKIIGATTLWVYNTKNRKLSKYVAKDNTTLSIKGTTIQNYDEKFSYQKTLRKPKDFIPLVVTEAKVPLSKAFLDIKAKSQAVNGRINSTTLLLRAIK